MSHQPLPTQDEFRTGDLQSRTSTGARAGRIRGWTLAMLGLVMLVPGKVVGQTEDSRSQVSQVQLPSSSATAAAVVEPWLYAIDRGGSDGSGTLFRLSSTGSGGLIAVQFVGETGVEDIFDIAFMGSRLFGIGPGNETFGTVDDVLIEINPNTGAVTPIGTIDVPGNFNALVGETGSTLLAASSSGEVWRINPDALSASRLGTFGGGLISSGDLSFAGGTLYGVGFGSGSDRLLVINPNTGRATQVGLFGFRDVHGLATNPLTGGLLGVADAESTPKLVSINRSSGAAAVLGRIPTSDAITGLAAAPHSAAPPCNAGADALFLESGRFRIDTCWRTSDGNSGTGKISHQQGIGATLWFFDATNPELFLKVVNACVPPFDRYWVFVAGLTNVEVTVKVTDQVRGSSVTYRNPIGQTMASVIDTDSFATCP